jgi:hypothetical protein
MMAKQKWKSSRWDLALFSAGHWTMNNIFCHTTRTQNKKQKQGESIMKYFEIQKRMNCNMWLSWNHEIRQLWKLNTIAVHNFWECAAIYSKTNFAPYCHNHRPRTPGPPVCAGPRASAMFKGIVEFAFCVGVRPWSPQLRWMRTFWPYLQSGETDRRRRGKTESSGGGGGTRVILFLDQNTLVNEEVWDGAFHDATASIFITEVRDEVFAHFHVVAGKRHNIMRNWQFGLPQRILCEHSPWCQRKWRACSWVCSSPVPPSSISVSSDFSIQTPAYGSCFIPRTLV